MQPTAKREHSIHNPKRSLRRAVLDWLSTENIGLSKCISYGNACDINEAELLMQIYVIKNIIKGHHLSLG